MKAARPIPLVRAQARGLFAPPSPLIDLQAPLHATPNSYRIENEAREPDRSQTAYEWNVSYNHE
jgi:hypothetical protein